MSDPHITAMLADLHLYEGQLSERDSDFVQMIDLANDAGESIGQRNLSRLARIHQIVKGEPKHD